MFISSTFTDTAQERNLLIADGSCLSDVFVMIVIVHNKPMKALILSGTPIHGSRKTLCRAVRIGVLAPRFCVVFLGKTLNSYSPSPHPVV